MGKAELKTEKIPAVFAGCETVVAKPLLVNGKEHLVKPDNEYLRKQQQKSSARGKTSGRVSRAVQDNRRSSGGNYGKTKNQKAKKK